MLDFEATCDREPGMVEKEVLAIPFVLLDTVTRTIVSEVQTKLVCATCDSSGADRVLRRRGVFGYLLLESSRVVYYYRIL